MLGMIDTNLIKNLKASPMFNLSLSSKELFHSNFLAWVIEKYPKEMQDIFRHFLKDENISFLKDGFVERESKKIDLTINLEGGKKIIIENKVKSTPDKEQLIKYSEKEGENKNNYYILLSFHEPGFFERDKFREWIYISYNELVREIKKTLPRNDPFVEDYILFVENLLKLFESFEFKTLGDFYSDSYNYKEMKDIRMHDIYHKYFYNRLKEKLRGKLNYLSDKEVRQVGETHIGDFFSRSTGCVGGEILTLPSHKEREIRDSELQFQLQDNHLRLILSGPYAKEVLEEKEEDSEFRKWLEDYFSFLKKEVEEKGNGKFPNEKNRRKKLCGLNKYRGIKINYFYRNIDLYKELTIDDLIDLFLRAIEHLKKHNVRWGNYLSESKNRPPTEKIN
jgi:hypothetical protein